METMNPKVDQYLAEGCMRCPLGGTPECKVHRWPEELKRLRSILLDCGLTEELKWSQPVYTFNNRNVLLMSALKDYCMVSFFKGVLLKDPGSILIQQTVNMQAARQIRFTHVDEIVEKEAILRAYVAEAIEVEKAGLKVPFKTTSEFDVPEELMQKMEEDPAFESAFYALTPGRQRGYLLYFSGAKQSRTRTARIENYMSLIFEGKGLHDNYSKKK